MSNESDKSDNNLIKGLLALGVIAVVVMIAVSLVQLPAGGETDSTELKKFTTSDEVLNFLKSQEEENQRQHVSGGHGAFDGFMSTGDSKVQSAETTADNGAMSVPMPAVTAAPVTAYGDGMVVSSSSSADEFSGTNIQVKGVDEADFLKNDGKYIYIVGRGQYIVD